MCRPFFVSAALRTGRSRAQRLQAQVSSKHAKHASPSSQSVPASRLPSYHARDCHGWSPDRDEAAAGPQHPGTEATSPHRAQMQAAECPGAAAGGGARRERDQGGKASNSSITACLWAQGFTCGLCTAASLHRAQVPSSQAAERPGAAASGGARREATKEVRPRKRPHLWPVHCCKPTQSSGTKQPGSRALGRCSGCWCGRRAPPRSKR